MAIVHQWVGSCPRAPCPHQLHDNSEEEESRIEVKIDAPLRRFGRSGKAEFGGESVKLDPVLALGLRTY
jgi:hypothetical protein